MSAEEPMITPPAKVAFRIYSMFIFPLCKSMEMISPLKEETIMDKTVFTNALCLLLPVYRAPLKEGQYNHKNKVPMNENTFE